MGARVARFLTVGAVMWAGLTACSTVLVEPGAGSFRSGSGLAAPVTEPTGAPVALVRAAGASQYLARLNPRTLEERERLDLGRQAQRVTSFSPDGRSLMMVTTRGRVRVVDLRGMADLLAYPLDVRTVTGVFWAEQDVAVATVSTGGGTELVRFDPSSGIVLGTDEIPGRAFASEHVDGRLVLLLYDTDSGTEPGPTTIATYDAAGNLASAAIGEIRSGFFRPEGDDLYRRLHPALAVRDGVATVVGTDGTIAWVELAGLSVEIEDPAASFFEEVAGWFVAPAHAKGMAGTAFEAQWIGAGALLVTGYRVEVTRETEYSVAEHVEPAGAVLLDPDDWSTHVVDEDATVASAAGDLLLAAHKFVPGDDERDGIGVRAYDTSGVLQWHALGSELAEVVAVRDETALVRHGWGRTLISSVDLDSGKVLATRPLWAAFPPETGSPF